MDDGRAILRRDKGGSAGAVSSGWEGIVKKKWDG